MITSPQDLIGRQVQCVWCGQVTAGIITAASYPVDGGGGGIVSLTLLPNCSGPVFYSGMLQYARPQFPAEGQCWLL